MISKNNHILNKMDSPATRTKGIIDFITISELELSRDARDKWTCTYILFSKSRKQYEKYLEGLKIIITILIHDLCSLNFS